MPIKPLTHKPIKVKYKRHTVTADYESKTRKDFTNASGYGYKWRLASRAHLKANPLCVECEKSGRAVLAVVVDHRQPHRGDMALFWDKPQWDSLCVHHHNSKTAKGL